MRNVVLEQLDKCTELLQYFTSSAVTFAASDSSLAATNIGTGFTAGDSVVIAASSEAANNTTMTIKTVAAAKLTMYNAVTDDNAGETITITQEWPGEYKETHGFAALTGTINCSGNAIIYIDQSGNGVDTDYTSSWAVTGGTALSFEVSVLLPFAKMRIRTNAADQTTMRAYLYGRKIS